MNFYAGVNAAGLHAEVSQNGGTSYGFEEKVYYGIGNNTDHIGMDNQTGSRFSQKLRLPTLGKLGHLTFGTSYDVSSRGSQEAMTEHLNDLAKEKSFKSPEHFFEPDIIDAKGARLYSQKKYNEIKSFLSSIGMVKETYQAHTLLNNHDGAKYKYHKSGLWGNYGNIEFIYHDTLDGVNRYHASYNYGNHWWTHLAIDYLGYKWRLY